MTTLSATRAEEGRELAAYWWVSLITGAAWLLLAVIVFRNE